jgi:tetratricopeptide (TPR) repeat protein
VKYCGTKTSLALVCLWLATPLAAQDDQGPRLIEQPPFDVMTLDAVSDNRVLKLFPIPLPGRRVPEKPRPSEKLRVKLLDTGEEYDVEWFHIVKLELYEQMILAEINKFSSEGKLDDAYDDLAFLLKHYPDTPGLAETRQNYLYLSSAAAFRQQKYDEALAILEELLALNPQYRAGENSPPSVQRLGDIADRLIGQYVAREDYRSARTLLARLTRQYSAGREPFAQKWRTELEKRAAIKRDEARAHLEAGRYVEAHDACSAMQMIWPEVSGATELAAEISRKHPLVRVAVEHPAVAFDSNSLYDLAARRAGRLTQRLLVELTGLSTEGGKYESPLATIGRSDDSRSLTLTVRPPADEMAAYGIVHHLLAQASEGSAVYDVNWSRLIASIAMPQPGEVQINLRSPHVRPEAFLALPLASLTPKPAASQPYSRLSREKSSTRFVTMDGYPLHRAGQPEEVIERHFADPQRALMALQHGEVDVLDRVFPGDIPTLRADASLTIAPYAGPTTHLLAVRSANPFLANRTFRRALLYASNRELLLSQGLLRGKTVAGYRVTSSVFPAPVVGMELPTYGYDAQIEPRPYNPRLALTLRLAAEGELKVAFEKQEQKAPRLGALLLGHPADEVSRIACRGLARQWKIIGIDCKLVEFPPGVFDDTKRECDLVYLQLAAWEPVHDVSRLFGAGGLIAVDSDAVRLAVRAVEEARNWQEVRQRLLVLHRLLHEQATVLPLWQTMDHFACRRSLVGPRPRPASLYQDIEQWQVAPAAVARSQR